MIDEGIGQEKRVSLAASCKATFQSDLCNLQALFKLIQAYVKQSLI